MVPVVVQLMLGLQYKQVMVLRYRPILTIPAMTHPTKWLLMSMVPMGMVLMLISMVMTTCIHAPKLVNQLNPRPYL